jgi:hypothetical protein
MLLLKSCLQIKLLGQMAFNTDFIKCYWDIIDPYFLDLLKISSMVILTLKASTPHLSLSFQRKMPL